MNNLQVMRKSHGLSQSQFAALCGWSQSRIGHYETGRREPSLSDIRLIVDVLSSLGDKCDIDQVFPAPKDSRIAISEASND